MQRKVHEPCDLVLRNVRWLDVFGCAFPGDVAIKDGVVVGTRAGAPRAGARSTRRGAHVVPGFIDAHVHLESSLLVPESFQRAVLPRGTTTAVCDPHELANVLGVPGIQFFLDAAERRAAASLDLRVMVSSLRARDRRSRRTAAACSTRRARAAPRAPEDARPRRGHERARRALTAIRSSSTSSRRSTDARSTATLRSSAGRRSRPMPAPGSRRATRAPSSTRRRRSFANGIAVWIREGSVAKDLDALAPLLTLATSTSVGFCTDDRNPLDIAHEGHLDWLVRSAIEKGVPAEVAYRAASWCVARHYGLAGPARGGERVGAIAPGYRADLVLLDDVATCAIRDVLVGRSARRARSSCRARRSARAAEHDPRGHSRSARDLEGPSGHGARHRRARRTHPHRSPRARRTTRPACGGSRVLERYGHGQQARQRLRRRASASFDGAIASSVGHDSHNLSSSADDPSDMRAALAALAEVGGGFCVVRGRRACSRALPLPLGGLMSLEEPGDDRARARRAARREQGDRLRAARAVPPARVPSLPVIPSLKLTDRGLMDVDAFKLIDVRAA